jgi:hypothetical protein
MLDRQGTASFIVLKMPKCQSMIGKSFAHTYTLSIDCCIAVPLSPHEVPATFQETSRSPSGISNSGFGLIRMQQLIIANAKVGKRHS